MTVPGTMPAVRRAMVSSPICLRTYYAMSGTELRYVWYYGVSGTELRYGNTGVVLRVSGTDPHYGTREGLTAREHLHLALAVKGHVANDTSVTRPIDCIFLFATMSADPSSEMSRLLWDNGRLLWGDAEQEGEEGAREREGGGDRSAHLSPRLGRVGSQGPLSS
eukprot:3690657-Rhodomonas_salina.2